MKISEKLKERTLNSQFNLLIKKFTQIANKGNNEYLLLKIQANKYTFNKLKEEGFNIEEVDYKDYTAYKISW
jgi:hypothetical protein